MEIIKKNAWVIVTAILFIHFTVSLFVSSQESMTYDERAHIPAAYSYVAYGDMRLNPEHPPLLKDLAGIPLLFLNLTFPLHTPEWESGINEQWKLGDLFVNCTEEEIACNNTDLILFWSRLPILFVTLLLGFWIYKWTKEIGGTLAGLFAVLLFAFDPNILAHNHYVTTDIGIAASIFLSFYFFVHFLKNPSFKNILLSGIFLGLAELTKFSAVLLFPIFGLFVLLYALSQKSPQNENIWLFKTKNLITYLTKYAWSIVIAFVLIWILYALNTYSMPSEKVVSAAHLYLSQDNVFAKSAQATVIFLGENALLKPFGAYFLGVFMVFARVASGNEHYFLGEVTGEASPWYFPLVFILKETLPFLFLLFFSFFYSLVHIVKRVFSGDGLSFLERMTLSFQNKITTYLTVFFILFYAYISITGKLNIGFRHLFPIMPFLYMLVAKVIFDFYKRHERTLVTQKMLQIILGLLIFSIVSVPILSYPSYLSYFNIAAGGHTNGYMYVTDSNYDWGQDLKRLEEYVNTHNDCTSIKSGTRGGCLKHWGYPKIDAIRVDYFGGGSPKYYLKEKYVPWWDKRAPEAGWYAISSFFYQESLYRKNTNGENYSWLKGFTPIARAGDSIFIYYISPESLSQ